MQDLDHPQWHRAPHQGDRPTVRNPNPNPNPQPALFPGRTALALERAPSANLQSYQIKFKRFLTQLERRVALEVREPSERSLSHNRGLTVPCAHTRTDLSQNGCVQLTDVYNYFMDMCGVTAPHFASLLREAPTLVGCFALC
jgi:hypothetical protein